MTITRSLAAATLLAGLLLASAARADDPARLGKSEATALLAGKTMVYNGSNGLPLRVYFAADGRLSGRGSGSGKLAQSEGAWKIDDEGKICVTIRQGSMNDRCYYVVKNGEALAISASGQPPGQPITVE